MKLGKQTPAAPARAAPHATPSPPPRRARAPVGVAVANCSDCECCRMWKGCSGISAAAAGSAAPWGASPSYTARCCRGAAGPPARRESTRLRLVQLGVNPKLHAQMG